MPVVVLVHGSGPQDRDESIGPNKPFLDLSHGLAARGIAVLRYEKRTRQYGAAMVAQANSLTVKQETIDDVTYAIEYLKTQPEIDQKRMFIAGHSLGGMLLPRIAKRTPEAAGYIGLAGCSRPLEDTMVQQLQKSLPVSQHKRPRASRVGATEEASGAGQVARAEARDTG